MEWNEFWAPERVAAVRATTRDQGHTARTDTGQLDETRVQPRAQSRSAVASGVRAVMCCRFCKNNKGDASVFDAVT